MLIGSCNFYNEHGSTIQYNVLVKDYKLNKLPYLTYCGIVSAIPSHWKSCIGKNNDHNDNIIRLIKFEIIPKAPKYIYTHLIQNKITTPRAIARWEDVFPEYNFHWNTIFNIPYITVF